VTLVTKETCRQGLFNGPRVATLDDALVNVFTSTTVDHAVRGLLQGCENS
jgi:hypothetical protein